MPIADSNMALHENVRGGKDSPKSQLATHSQWSLVLGQDPLIPPQLLQAEIPAVCLDDARLLDT